MRRSRKCLVALLVAAFVVFMPVRNAMAVTSIPYNTIVYGPLDIGGIFGFPVVESIGVCAHDKYAAAMTALGYGGDVVTGLDSNKKALLSNQSTGGAFWTYAQHFVNPSSSGNLTERMVYRYAELYGSGVVWAAEYQESEKASAVVALQNVLNGGGGGGEIDGDFVYYDCTLTGYQNTAYSDFSGVALRKNFVQSLLNTVSANSDKNLSLWIAFGGWAGDVSAKSRFVTVTLTSAEPQFDTDHPYPAYRWVVGAYTLRSGNGFTAGDSKTTADHDGKTYAVFGPELQSATTYEVVVNNYAVEDGCRPVYGYYYGDVRSGPSTPPNNWPDTPEVTTPTAPEVPEPTNTETPAQPAQPTAPTLPDFPSNVISPGTTYETFDIQAILQAMDEHCQHLQSAIYQGFSDYFDTFTPWLRDEFSTLRTFLREEDDWIVESISDEFMELRSYIKELAEWLADQMDFTITGGDYDDSTVVSWLKKIYYKLGGASVNTKPVDPVGDPDGSWDWLNQLIEGILSALAGGAANLAGSLGDLFQGIKDKFPFSIPWDIVAIVALLDAPPVTPAAVIEYDVFGAHVRYDIDLHFFDEQASVIRAMEDVIFCAFLLFKTDWLSGIFDGIGGFLGGKLKSTVKGV